MEQIKLESHVKPVTNEKMDYIYREMKRATGINLKGYNGMYKFCGQICSTWWIFNLLENR